MPDARSRPDRPPAERLPLGQASRLLGVDPDTLRRWADEGRVPAFTTLGGHRRFERRALERLVAARRTGAAGRPRGPRRHARPPQRRLPPPLRRAHGRGSDIRSIVPEAQRERVPRVRPQPRRGARRATSTAIRATAPARRRGGGARARGVLGERAPRPRRPAGDAVSMFIAARQPFLAELRSSRAGAGVDARRVGQLYDASTGLLDRLLLAFVAAHAHRAGDDRVESRSRRTTLLPALTSILAFLFAADAARPVARAAARLPGSCGRSGCCATGSAPARRRSPPSTAGTSPSTALVPDRRRLDGRLAGPRDGVPARADAVRLHVRGAAAPVGRCSRS